ncbi:hypothetical protein FISHEDRAFT_78496 [Fistulina hepatica ATCC 64428]|nr:hypothetical protein FISHEDRAFT_78496 [Fistulina hepatica ATCC 64428]
MTLEAIVISDDEPTSPKPIADLDSCLHCQRDFSGLDSQERSEHYKTCQEASVRHSTRSKAAPKLAPTIKDVPDVLKTVKKSFKKQCFGEDDFWCPLDVSEPPHNTLPNVIPLLKKALTDNIGQARKGRGNTTQRAALAYDRSTFISTELPFDKMWGCGYRNFMMACAALITQEQQPQYRNLLQSPLKPGVRNLQTWIENAWDAGYDEAGKKELKSLKDLWVAFAFRGIPVELVDFKLKSGSSDALVRWIEDYFSRATSATNVNERLLGAEPVASTDRMPLILQHSGHSRIVIGYEVGKGGKVANLLVFDPGRSIPKDLRAALVSGARKRKVSSVHEEPQKRQRSASSSVVTDDDDVVEIAEVLNKHDHAESSSKTSSSRDDIHKTVLRFCRLDVKYLNKDKYQILYFPMTAPLTDDQRGQYKVVKALLIKG